jgi:hypothetical protein
MFLASAYSAGILNRGGTKAFALLCGRRGNGKCLPGGDAKTACRPAVFEPSSAFMRFLQRKVSTVAPKHEILVRVFALFHSNALHPKEVLPFPTRSS